MRRQRRTVAPLNCLNQASPRTAWSLLRRPERLRGAHAQRIEPGGGARRREHGAVRGIACGRRGLCVGGRGLSGRRGLLRGAGLQRPSKALRRRGALRREDVRQLQGALLHPAVESGHHLLHRERARELPSACRPIDRHPSPIVHTRSGAASAREALRAARAARARRRLRACAARRPLQRVGRHGRPLARRR